MYLKVEVCAEECVCNEDEQTWDVKQNFTSHAIDDESAEDVSSHLKFDRTKVILKDFFY